MDDTPEISVDCIDPTHKIAETAEPFVQDTELAELASLTLTLPADLMQDLSRMGQ